MNEEALKYAHELFTKDGYSGSLDDYKKLIETNKEALDYSYKLFKKDGYTDNFDTFQGLLGVKKKELESVLYKNMGMVQSLPKLLRQNLKYLENLLQQALRALKKH